MTIEKDKIVEAKDVNNRLEEFKQKLIDYEIKRQALLVKSVWENTTPDPIPTKRGEKPIPVVYNGSFSFNPDVAVTDELIEASLINKLAEEERTFNERLRDRISPEDIIKPDELKEDYTNTEIVAENFNVLFTILTRANNLLSQYDYYTSYIPQRGTCKRTCQVACQTACQLSCQSYHSCHNQKCGMH